MYPFPGLGHLCRQAGWLCRVVLLARWDGLGSEPASLMRMAQQPWGEPVPAGPRDTEPRYLFATGLPHLSEDLGGFRARVKVAAPASPQLTTFRGSCHLPL